ncbi:MAG: DUF2309 family protein [Rhodobacteraceae bacterium]|nr:DUF2309 family protein [Paracoccaceae bacterium]
MIPAGAEDILAAAEAAAAAIPPAFPLDATVAVNPFLGQTGEGLAMAAARLGRVGGVRILPDAAALAGCIAAGEIAPDDLAGALAAAAGTPGCPADTAALLAALAAPAAPPAALPTVAELAARATGTDWPAVVERAFGAWAAGHFDRGQALWTPAPGRSALAAWREWATHDLTPGLAGLAGFCAHVAASPDTADRAILRAAATLGLTPDAAPTAFHRLLADLGGWAQHARWLGWQAALRGAEDPTLTDLLAIRLVWEEALLLHAGAAVAAAWQRTVAAHAAPVRPDAATLAAAIVQDAAERGFQRRLAARLAAAAADRSGAADPAAAPRPALQAAFCIDVRSEPFRRALEGLDPGIETLGFAGFFGLPLAHRAAASDLDEARLPVLLCPALGSAEAVGPASDRSARIAARAARAWDRFRKAAVSSFAFVEAAGPLYAGRLVRDALGLAPAPVPAAAPAFAPGLAPARAVATAAAVLRAMSFTAGHARLVLLLGHGAQVTNNPHASAYHCGACGGHSGEVSARLLASLLNDPATRAGLAAEGIVVPADTRFLAGLHDTTTDRVELFVDSPAPAHADDIAAARRWLARAGALARAARAPGLPGATAATLAARARDWSEVRPEWGLAGCAAFIAAPRQLTRRADLGGRAFLHSYDWRADRDFATLGLILTAPVVVAGWISLQYYGSAVAPDAFGSGNKLIHNVTGGIGVVEGNGGRLRAGLPWQAVHDGARLVHELLRLSVLIEAPPAAMTEILARHPEVRALFDNGWLHLIALAEGRPAARYRPGLAWQPAGTPPGAAA